MRRTLPILLAGLLGCVDAQVLEDHGAQHRVSVAEPDNSMPADATPVRRASSPAVIDGVIDEPFWATATPVRADYDREAPGVVSDHHMTVRYAWDDLYLYIAYETFDRNVKAEGTGERLGPWGNQRDGCNIYNPKKKVDVVEFFVGFGDEHFFWEFHHNALNQWNDVWCAVPDKSWPFAKSSMLMYEIHFMGEQYLKDDRSARLASAVRPKPRAGLGTSTVNDESDQDTGYIAEIRIPWRGLGAPQKRMTRPPNGSAEPSRWNMAGEHVNVLAVVQDADLSVRYHSSGPALSGTWFHKTFADWPVYRLID